MAERQTDRSALVPAGGDRFRKPRKVLGTMSIDRKVSGSETGGELLIIENTNGSKGGPPRHLHHGQEEWFYVVEGEYVVEIGDERYRLDPGDSIFAPREIPHVWAHVGEGTGRLILAFRPAGGMEAFFEAMSGVKGAPSSEELRGLFRSHGMEVTGPPLEVE
ncbi:cupin domain-containing protein [Rubrobacter tropicus]|uniref:Cupin domain-containing protein n=1 Tax=Rubrobacter tropicus TaxID=2653851 RepID=A0A6G8QA84_9ACTN|nr:cupin domain-containing protein [Rubrobacter tropicus]QIN83386.1 cupin domain-containing protein [Rubrobacter tropicus]